MNGNMGKAYQVLLINYEYHKAHQQNLSPWKVP